MAGNVLLTGANLTSCNGIFEPYDFSADGTRIYVHSLTLTHRSNLPCRFLWREQSPPYDWRAGADHLQTRSGRRVVAAQRVCASALFDLVGTTLGKCEDMCRSKASCAHFSYSSGTRTCMGWRGSAPSSPTVNDTTGGLGCNWESANKSSAGTTMYALGSMQPTPLRGVLPVNAACVENVSSWLELATVTRGGVSSQSEIPSAALVTAPLVSTPALTSLSDSQGQGVCQQLEQSGSTAGITPFTACSRSSVTSAWIDFDPGLSAWTVCGMCLDADANQTGRRLLEDPTLLSDVDRSATSSRRLTHGSESGANKSHATVTNSSRNAATGRCALSFTASGLQSACPIYYVAGAAASGASNTTTSS